MRGLLLLLPQSLLLLLLPHLALNMLQAGQVQVKQVKRPSSPEDYVALCNMLLHMRLHLEQQQPAVPGAPGRCGMPQTHIHARARTHRNLQNKRRTHKLAHFTATSSDKCWQCLVQSVTVSRKILNICSAINIPKNSRKLGFLRVSVCKVY